MPGRSKPSTDETPTTLEAILAKRGGKYLSDQEKHEFSRDETPFLIVDMKKGQGSYGKRWELSIKAGKREAILTVPFHDARDEQFAALTSLVAKNGPQGPVTLSIRAMDNGNEWVSLNMARAKNGK